jgi:acetyltransferase-like isoleucine patch superfamily enzyme
MSAKSYLKGFIKNLFNIRVSSLSLIDDDSKFGKTSKIYRFSKIVNSSVGDYSYIAPRTNLVYARIGKFCSIGANCLIGLPSHSIKNISTSPIFTSKNNALNLIWNKENTYLEYSNVEIGNDVWIGSNAIIMGGIKIGNGAVVGAGAVVTKDIPDYAIVGGVPAKVLKMRFTQDVIEKLLSIKWWDSEENELKKNIKYFNLNGVSTSDVDEMMREICKE